MASSPNNLNHASSSDQAEENSDSVNFIACGTTSSVPVIRTSTSGPSSGDNLMPAPSSTAEPEGQSEDANASKVTPIAWKHMQRVTIKGELKAICKHCNTKLSAEKGIGTRHLLTHVKSCLRKKKRTEAYHKLLVAKRKLNGETIASDQTFDQEECREELVGMIILHEYPLSIVGQVGFRKFVHYLQPSFLPCRNTVRSDVIGLYKEQMKKTMSLLDNNEGRVAITIDMSTTDNGKKGYMAVTAYFVDNSWCLQQHLLRSHHVPAPHTRDVINDQLLHILLDWNLDKKLSTITVDSSFVSDGIVECMLEKVDNDQLLLGGSILHMPCGAHILNQIVKDGLDSIAPSLEKIRNSCVFWSSTPKRMEKFEETADQLCITSTKRLCYDVIARWKSTYGMMETAMIYKDVFHHLKNCDPQYKSAPSDEDWENAKMITEKLEIFLDVSGRKYTTVNNYFPAICEIRISLSTWLLDSNPIIANMASRMFEKFDKYWQKIHGIMGVAAVLDPRFKALILEFYYEKLYGSNYMDEVNKVVNLCRALVGEYQKRNKQEGGKPSYGGNKLIEESEFWEAFNLYLERKRRRTIINELDHYLEKDVIPWVSKFDVLDWWKFNGSKYPILQRVARDIYAIPFLSVAFESAFSMADRSINQRNVFHPELIQALAFARKNWTHIGLPE